MSLKLPGNSNMIQSNKPARARRGDLVRIHVTVLQPEQRASHLPEATRSVPFEGWIKGFLLDEQAVIGQVVRIKTLIGREISGVLMETEPIYEHNFGRPQPELNLIGQEAWQKLEGKVHSGE
jgi:hypothetical protein